MEVPTTPLATEMLSIKLSLSPKTAKARIAAKMGPVVKLMQLESVRGINDMAAY